MKVLVTGSSGFIGSYVVAELKNHKHTVNECLLSKSFDITKRETLSRPLKGIDAVVHLAGILDSHDPRIHTVNVTGTENLLLESKKAKVKRFVFISSTGVYGFTRYAITEESLLSPENNYEKSKVNAENVVLREHGKMHVSIIRSALVFGPNGYWKKMISMLKEGYPLPCPGTNTFQIIYAKNLARAIVMVLEKGESGEIYIAADTEKHTLNGFCALILASLKKKGHVRHIPTWFGLMLGMILGIKVLTRENIRHLAKERNYGTKKLEDLGTFQKETTKEAIYETLDIMENGKEFID